MTQVPQSQMQSDHHNEACYIRLDGVPHSELPLHIKLVDIGLRSLESIHSLFLTNQDRVTAIFGNSLTLRS